MNVRPILLTSLVIALSACDDGDNGMNGADGSNGLNSLVSQTALPVLGADCACGGIQFDSGIDQDSDGTLSAGEVSETSVVCNAGEAPEVDTALQTIITQQALTGDASAGRTLPSIDDPTAQLGMHLFFTKGLGGDQDSACVTCHHPFLGGGDDLALPIGVGADVQDLLGPGRSHMTVAEGFDGGPTVPRNAPTTFNVSLWDEVLFHDGRVESLTKTAGTNGSDGPIRTPDSAFGVADPLATGNLVAAQARFPVTSPEEMRGFVFEDGNTNNDVRDHLELRLRGTIVPAELATNDWLEEFRTAFNEPAGTADALITYDNIAAAIADYENSQTFVDNAFSRYIAGDTAALDADAKLGALLFFGEAGCVACHSGDFFSDEQFHVIAMPQIGRGKGNDNGVNTDDDFGRFRETGVEADRYAFRTPSLLNVADTGPFTHAGAYVSLRDVVQHHITPRASVEDYDISQLPAGTQTDNTTVNTLLAVDQLEALQTAGTSLLPVVDISPSEVGYLVAFLESLTDYCLLDSQCIGRWVPNVNDNDPDDLRVRAVDQNGNPLTL